MLIFQITDIKFFTAILINTYLKAKTFPSPNTTQILNLKYVFIVFAAPNWMLEYTIIIDYRSKKHGKEKCVDYLENVAIAARQLR